jgi:preprotein translocase subunit SecD
MIRLSRWKVLLVVAATVIGILLSLPNLLSPSVRNSLPGWLPKQTLNLGLDLQGGSYLLLEVDVAALRRERLTNLLEDVRRELREARIASSNLAVTGEQIGVRINDPAQLDAAFRTLDQLGAPMPSNPSVRDITVSRAPDNRLLVSISPEAFALEESRAVEQSIEIVRRRIDELGTREPSILRQGANRIVVQAPGESDPERLKRVIGQTAKLTFQMVDESVPAAEAIAGRVPPGSVLVEQDNPAEPQILLKRRVLVSGESLTDAQASFDERNQPVVTFRFDSQGARRFARATTENVNRRFAIVLDDRVITAPTINEPITGGSGQISGNFTVETANDLAVLLRAGALPAPLNVEEQRTVGAELGADAVKAGQISTMLALLAVLIFMVLAYGWLFGGIAVIALIVNGILIIAAMSVIQASLTLPGIAGLILTLAVAVDANVLIYERMRDELRAGRPPIVAMDAGFSRAMETILDANLTTLAAALIMFFFGAGPVRGFAWTLSIGVLTSVFTAVMITQVLLAWWYRTYRPKTLPIA